MTTTATEPSSRAVAESELSLAVTLPYADCPHAITDAGPAACTAWGRFTVEEGYLPLTRLTYRRIAKRFLGWLKAERIALAQVLPRDVERFLDGHAVSLRSKITYRTALRRFFDSLLDHEIVRTNPAALVGQGSEAMDAGSPVRRTHV